MTDETMKQDDSAVRALVLRSAGTNCDAETVQAFEMAGASVDLVHLNALVRDPKRLADASILAVPGGFSYGDNIAAGRVFGIELRHHLLEPLQRFVQDGGLVVGICNGFQILVELGMFEELGQPASARRIALTDNASNRFECRWVTLRSEECACPWLVGGETMPVPVAHAEGRFVVRDPETLAELRENGQIALTYLEPGAESAGYPHNPNGSTAGIAGICDRSGRVLGLMPHPERNLSPWNHPTWTRLGAREEGEGLPFYRRMVQVAADGRPALA
jgi:phosphoribosylformylglycinamidine synthase subunit PurQ / glutaminase